MRRWFRFPGRIKMLTDWNAVRSLGVPACGLLVMAAALASSGCDAASFVPPQPDELRGSGGTAAGGDNATAAPASLEIAPAPARAIELVLDQRDPDEAEVSKSAARTQAGINNVKLKISILGTESPKAKQVELVREALAHHPRVLVVEPADPADPQLAQAIREAQGQGIPVVLLNRPLTGLEPARAITGETKAKSSASPPEPTPSPATRSTPGPSPAPQVVVAAPPFASSAEQLVKSAIRNAEDAKLDPRAGAVVVVNTLGDPFIPERVLAIRNALKDAGITTIGEVRFARDVQAGEKLLTEHLLANPKVVLIFAVDSASSTTFRQVIQSKTNRRGLVVGCYVGEEQVADLTRLPNCAAVAEFTPTRAIRKAISTAVALSQGRDVPRRVELPINVNDMPENATYVKAQMQKGKEAEAEK
jgi:ABC-type sugar transport system substrate-binding protein